MKKALRIAFIFITILTMGNCSIDDSNDIEVIKPGDTVITGMNPPRQPS
ncbi:hypothetical protein [Pareuzebyella sediminis]|nr:hypothetical protein [Pareuzebyella sediminis]